MPGARVVIASQLSTAILNSELGKKHIGTPSNANPHLKAGVKLGATTAQAAFTVWQAMFEAGTVLLSAATDASADLIDHRYGEEAGAAAREAGSVVKDMGKVPRVQPSAIRWALRSRACRTDAYAGVA